MKIFTKIKYHIIYLLFVIFLSAFVSAESFTINLNNPLVGPTITGLGWESCKETCSGYCSTHTAYNYGSYAAWEPGYYFSSPFEGDATCTLTLRATGFFDSNEIDQYNEVVEAKVNGVSFDRTSDICNSNGCECLVSTKTSTRTINLKSTNNLITARRPGDSVNIKDAVLTCEYEEPCVPDYRFTDWSDWTNISCLPEGLMNESRTITFYDANECGAEDEVFTEYRAVEECGDECVVELVNSSWSEWYDMTECIDNTKTQSRYRVEYDINNCGDYDSKVYFDEREEVCEDECEPDLEFSEWSDWTNLTCLDSGFMNQSRYRILYDANECDIFDDEVFTEYQAIEECGDECIVEWVNSSWSDWYDLTECVDNTKTQSRYLIEYDSNNCGNSSKVHFEEREEDCEDECEIDIQDIATPWTNVSCLPEGLMNETRNITWYDANSCGIFENITYPEYRAVEECGDECDVNLTSDSAGWYNVSECRINNTILQNMEITWYDANSCGTYNNETFNYTQEVPCDYCQYDNVNNSWTSWYNTSECVDGFVDIERNRTEYDANYETCYAVTLLDEDLWNFGDNITHYETDSDECYTCVVDLVNETGEWYNVTECLANNTIMQERAITQYDSNFCGYVDNSTVYEYGDIPCDFCVVDLVNSTGDWYNITGCRADDTQLWQRATLQYDDNFCGEVDNSTTYENDTRPCDYCTPYMDYDYGGWYNVSECNPDNEIHQEMLITYYDTNNCGEENNQSYYDHQTIPCDFCTPDLVNETGEWCDVSECREDDTILQERMIWQYDYNECDEGGEAQYYEYQTKPCDFCVPDLINTTWTEWTPITECQEDDTITLVHYLTQYDQMFCNEIDNLTYVQYGSSPCDYQWPPYFVSVPITTAYPDIEYKYDSDALDPDNDVLTYSLLYGPLGITINSANGMIEWMASHSDVGNCYPVSVQVTDNMFNVTQDYSICVDMPSVEKYPRRKLYIDTIRMNNMVYDYVEPNGALDIDVSYENWGVYDVKRSTIRVTVYELGISRRIGPFNGPYLDKDYLKTVPLIIPENAEPGVYTLRMALTTNDQVKRVKHRDFRVI